MAFLNHCNWWDVNLFEQIERILEQLEMILEHPQPILAFLQHLLAQHIRLLENHNFIRCFKNILEQSLIY